MHVGKPSCSAVAHPGMKASQYACLCSRVICHQGSAESIVLPSPSTDSPSGNRACFASNHVLVVVVIKQGWQTISLVHTRFLCEMFRLDERNTCLNRENNRNRLERPRKLQIDLG